MIGGGVSLVTLATYEVKICQLLLSLVRMRETQRDKGGRKREKLAQCLLIPQQKLTSTLMVVLLLLTMGVVDLVSQQCMLTYVLRMKKQSSSAVSQLFHTLS